MVGECVKSGTTPQRAKLTSERERTRNRTLASATNTTLKNITKSAESGVKKSYRNSAAKIERSTVQDPKAKNTLPWLINFCMRHHPPSKNKTPNAMPRVIRPAGPIQLL